MDYSVGVAIGGTKIAIALINQNGEIISQTAIPTDLSITPKEMIGRTCEEIKNVVTKSAIKQEEIIGIGIGAPGREQVLC